jgi:hypothetical protein
MLLKGIHPNPKPATCQSIQDCGSAFREMGRYILLRSFTPTECWWDSIRTPQLRRLCSLGLLLCLDGILDNRRQVYVLLCTSFKRVEYIRGDDSLLTPAWVDSLPLGTLEELDFTMDATPLPRFSKLLEHCTSLERCRILLSPRDSALILQFSLRTLASSTSAYIGPDNGHAFFIEGGIIELT